MADEKDTKTKTDDQEKKEPAPAAAEEKPAAKTEKASDEAKTGATEVPKEFKALVEQIESMSVLELHKLVKLLEERFGVSAQAVAVAAPAAAAPGAEEQSLFTVELTSGGSQKIAVIKVVKAALGLGLKEAKDLVEGAPAVLKTGMKKEEAENIKKQIEEAGGQVTLK
jgi:large subunit ribosomal protein L7/L12